jgi:hypothetical protein
MKKTEAINGYILHCPEKTGLGSYMSTMGAIQIFTDIRTAKEMAELCASKNISWIPKKIVVIIDSEIK